jgi:hypothetical protein
VVCHRLRVFVTNIRVDETLDGNHIARYDTGVLQKLLCLFVEAGATGDDRIRNGEEDDLDKLDADNLDVLEMALGRAPGSLHRSRSRSADRPLCRTTVPEE